MAARLMLLLALLSACAMGRMRGATCLVALHGSVVMAPSSASAAFVGPPEPTLRCEVPGITSNAEMLGAAFLSAMVTLLPLAL